MITKLLAIFITLTISLADISFFILAFILWANDKAQVKSEIFHFSFGGSPFDLVVLSLIRFSVMCGTCLGVLCSKSFTQTVQKLQHLTKVVVLFGCFQSVYVIFKIMYFTEQFNNNVSYRIWSMLGATLFTIMSSYSCSKLLQCCKFQVKVKRLIVNVDADDGTIQGESNRSHCSEESLTDVGSDEDDEDEDEDDGGCKINSFDRLEAKKMSTTATIFKLIKMAKYDVGYIAIAFLFLAAAAISETFLPYYIGNVLNYIVIEQSHEKLHSSMTTMTLLIVISGISVGIRAGMFTFLASRYTYRLQGKLFSSIIRMEVGFFDARKTGEITSRLTSDCTKIGDGLTYNLNIFVRSILQMIGYLFIMFKLSWKLSIVTLIALPIIGMFSAFFGKHYERLAEQVQNSLANANASAEEAISSVRTVRSFAGEDIESERYANRLKKTLGFRKKEGLLVMGYEWSIQMSDLLILLLILYYGGHLVIMKDLSGGHLISFVFYSWDMSNAVGSIGDNYTGLMDIVGSSKNVCYFIDREPLINNSGTFKSEDGLEGSIEFKDVTFAYPTRENTEVLKNISFTAKEGEVVALVGASGSGKSSILSLLQRFYDPNNGQVLVDGVDVKDYEHHYLHRIMSIVQQEPTLFARKINENILYGLESEEFNADSVEHASTLANAHSFISAMPEMYETETGEKGVQLSGGEKQRVAIARSIIREPKILLLDEATSALDSESEHAVQQAINKNLSGRTVIIIAHRLSSIEKADKILVMKDGEIIETGTHRQLLDKGGNYASLVRRQTGGDTSNACLLVDDGTL